MLHFISPNLYELRVISKFFDIPVIKNTDWEAEARLMAGRLSEHIPVIITTLGPQGVLVCVSEDLHLFSERTMRYSNIREVQKSAFLHEYYQILRYTV